MLERQIELCQELLKVAEVLEPGFSKFRGLLLYDLQTAVVVQAKRRYGREEIRREDVEVAIEGVATGCADVLFLENHGWRWEDAGGSSANTYVGAGYVQCDTREDEGVE